MENTVDYSFAQRVTFSLKVTSSADIAHVYLFFRAKGSEETEAVDLSIEEPRERISIEHVHDPRRSPFPPFATVTFWWQIEDAAGNDLRTDPQQFKYKDNRFDWGQLSGGGITVHWIEGAAEGSGDLAFGQAALDVAQASVKEINAELRAPLPRPLEIYIYNSRPNLESALMLTGRDWVGGQARPELGVILLAIPCEEGYRARMKRYIPHEITHLLLYQLVTPSGYRYVPEWLDEGLATANERLPAPEYTLALEEGRKTDQLLPLEELCSPFAPDPHAAILAYAQSASVVQFIRERHGAQGIRALLAAYADGASCAGGVEEALDVSLNGLETAWRASLEPQTPWQAWVDKVGVWAGLWLLSLLVAVPMIGRLRRPGSAPPRTKR